MNPSVPSPDTFVLRRATPLERAAARKLNRRIVVTLAVGVLLAVAYTAYAAFVLVFVPPSALAYLIAAALPALAASTYSHTLYAAFRLRRLARMLRGLELWMTPDGVAYRCAAGHFSVPWSSVREISIEAPKGRADHRVEFLFVHAENWPGPLAAYGSRRRPAAVVMPIAGSPVTRDWTVAEIRARRDGGTRHSPAPPRSLT